MPPRVLVLLAAYNGAHWIRDQVESILRQVNVEVDLVVSDDGSSDDTRTELSTYAPEHRFTLVYPPEPSGSAAQNFLWLFRNTLADQHDFVAFSDQDDIWEESKLFRACTVLHDTAASGYSCAVTAFWDKGREFVLKQADCLTDSDYLFEGAGQGCTFVITADLYGRLREFFVQNTRLTSRLHYHDWAVYALSRSLGEKWVFDPVPMLRYRQHGANDTGARFSIRGLIKRLRLLRSGWYSGQLRAIAELCSSVESTGPVAREWSALLTSPKGIWRRYRIVRFCIRGGRRRRLDNLALIAVAISGWI